MADLDPITPLVPVPPVPKDPGGKGGKPERPARKPDSQKEDTRKERPGVGPDGHVDDYA